MITIELILVNITVSCLMLAQSLLVAYVAAYLFKYKKYRLLIITTILSSEIEPWENITEPLNFVKYLKNILFFLKLVFIFYDRSKFL